MLTNPFYRHLLIFSPHPFHNPIKFSWYFDSVGESIVDTTRKLDFEPTIESDRFFMCSFQAQNQFYLVGGQLDNTRIVTTENSIIVILCIFKSNFVTFKKGNSIEFWPIGHIKSNNYKI